MMVKLIVIGTSGTSIDIVDTITDINEHQGPSIECLGFLDDVEENHGKSILGVKVLGPLNSAASFDKDVYFVNGIGSTSTYKVKEEILARLDISNERFMTIIHPTASVSKTSQIGKGAVIFQNVTVTSNAKIGNHVVVLPNSIISHDSVIGDYSCITGGVCISGRVSIGKSCYIGTNSAIRDSIKIGDFCLVGMGSVVVKDIPPDTIVMGNPARPKQKTR